MVEAQAVHLFLLGPNGRGPISRPYVAGEFSNLNINVRRNLLSTETVLRMHFALK